MFTWELRNRPVGKGAKLRPPLPFRCSVMGRWAGGCLRLLAGMMPVERTEGQCLYVLDLEGGSTGTLAVM